MATHDIITSLLLTAAFIILADYLLNENSKFCIIPEELKRIAMIVDVDLRKADIQREKHKQVEFVEYLQNFQ